MAVRKESGQYIVDVSYTPLSGGRRKRLRKKPAANTLKAARALERELEHHLSEGLDAAQRLTFAEHAERVLEINVSNLKQGTQKSYKQALRVHILPAIGHLLLDDIGVRDIEKLRSAIIKKGRAAKTANMVTMVVMKFLRLAHLWGDLRAVPQIKPLKEPEHDVEFLEPNEALQLLDAAEGQLKTMILCGLHTGMRIGELRSLCWQDVDLRQRFVRVRRGAWKNEIQSTKSGRCRTIPLSDDLAIALRDHRHLRSRLVFPDIDGSIIPYRTLLFQIQALGKIAGLPKVRGWHILRHTFASTLIVRGCDLKSLQGLLGHSSINMVLKYVHLTPQRHSEIINLLDYKSNGVVTMRSLASDSA